VVGRRQGPCVRGSRAESTAVAVCTSAWETIHWNPLWAALLGKNSRPGNRFSTPRVIDISATLVDSTTRRNHEPRTQHTRTPSHRFPAVPPPPRTARSRSSHRPPAAVAGPGRGRQQRAAPAPWRQAASYQRSRRQPRRHVTSQAILRACPPAASGQSLSRRPTPADHAAAAGPVGACLFARIPGRQRPRQRAAHRTCAALARRPGRAGGPSRRRGPLDGPWAAAGPSGCERDAVE
jgi:hypothetical protein